jgi:hypothetical protein
MPGRDESRSNIEVLTDAEIYDAIRYLEQDRGTWEPEGDSNGLIVCVCLYIMLLVGLTCLWLYR